VADRTDSTGNDPGDSSRTPGGARPDIDNAATLGIDPALLAILVCPASHAPLRLDLASSELVCDESGLAYPVRDGIPVLLIDEARPVTTGAA
jgi:uncharacterized protein YbaR (Trm112 family)